MDIPRKTLLFKTLAEMKPEKRFPYLQLILAVISLAGVVYFLYNKSSASQESRYEDCRQENVRKDAIIRDKDEKIDRMIHEKDSSNMAEIMLSGRRINRLDSILERQGKQKSVLRNIGR